MRPRRKPRTAKGPETNAKNRGSTTRFQNNMVVLLSISVSKFPFLFETYCLYVQFQYKNNRDTFLAHMLKKRTIQENIFTYVKVVRTSEQPRSGSCSKKPPAQRNRRFCWISFRDCGESGCNELRAAANRAAASSGCRPSRSCSRKPPAQRNRRFCWLRLRGCGELGCGSLRVRQSL